MDICQYSTGSAVREACRKRILTGQTSGLARGFTQANLVILPSGVAADFLLFCQRNPKPCPLLYSTSPGEFSPEMIASGSDLRTDLPRYRIWQNGELVDEPEEIKSYWQPDLVSFLIGCSFTFEDALERAGIPVRHVSLKRNVPMYQTNVPCVPAGPFHGNLVVSMRPMSPSLAIRAIQVTSRFPRVHGAPVHFGFPEQIGIRDISRPDFGDAVPVETGEVPVFWACGVTPQSILMAAKVPFAITHSPGCMFVTDWRDEHLTVG